MVEMATLGKENCYTKVITPPIFKLATELLPFSVYEELLVIYYVITPFCWPTLHVLQCRANLGPIPHSGLFPNVIKPPNSQISNKTASL